jgi:hypothetical protein
VPDTFVARTAARLRRLDSGERLVALARAGRRRLPGDHAYGDPLSLTGDEAPQVLGRGLSALADEQPSALRELGMGALQVWQSLSEAQGRGQGDREVLVSDAVRDRLDPEQIATRRRWRFKPKGAPKDLQAYVAEAST